MSILSLPTQTYFVLIGVSDIQNFVSVSLATAAGGEGDLVHDRLSNLRTVGSGFASLLYKLPETSSCCDLLKACTSLWNALDDNAALPDLLVSYCFMYTVEMLFMKYVGMVL
jgi:hypothetical protein